MLTSLTRMRWRQHQERRRGRRIALPADQHVLAEEQRLRAAAPLPKPSPLQTLRDALACLEAGIVAAGQQLPEIVGLHVTPDVLEVLPGGARRRRAACAVRHQPWPARDVLAA